MTALFMSIYLTFGLNLTAAISFFSVSGHDPFFALVGSYMLVLRALHIASIFHNFCIRH